MDKVQGYWTVQEDAHHTFAPARSNEEIKIALLPSFPWPVSKEGTQSPEPGFGVRRDSDVDSRKCVATIPPGPPLEGYLVIHESVVPDAPPDFFKREIF